MIICKSCKSTDFAESWENGPLICIKCGTVDNIEYIFKNAGKTDNQEL